MDSVANAVIFSVDDQQLFTGDENGYVAIWDMSTLKQINRLEGHTGAITELAFSSEGRFLASGSQDGTVVLWFDLLP